MPIRHLHTFVYADRLVCLFNLLQEVDIFAVLTSRNDSEFPSRNGCLNRHQEEVAFPGCSESQHFFWASDSRDCYNDGLVSIK